MRRTFLVMLLLVKPSLVIDGSAKVMNESYSAALKRTGPVTVAITEMLEFSVMVR